MSRPHRVGSPPSGPVQQLLQKFNFTLRKGDQNHQVDKNSKNDSSNKNSALSESQSDDSEPTSQASTDSTTFLRQGSIATVSTGDRSDEQEIEASNANSAIYLGNDHKPSREPPLSKFPPAVLSPFPPPLPPFPPFPYQETESVAHVQAFGAGQLKHSGTSNVFKLAVSTSYMISGDIRLFIDNLDEEISGRPPYKHQAIEPFSLALLCRLIKGNQYFPSHYFLHDVEFDPRFSDRGGSDVIYRGRHLGKDICLKKLPSQAKDKHEGERTMAQIKEIILGRQLDHPNIAQFLGMYESPKSELGDLPRCYLVSPWMKNGNVVDFLAGHPCSSEYRESLLYDITRGLQYLHNRNVIHGNLKGVNVLVSNEGRGVITDFESSIIHSSLPDPSLYDLFGPSVASLRWSAPELLTEGRRKIQSSDIWALGCVFYEILTGRLPFKADNAALDMAGNILAGVPPGKRSLEDHGGDGIWQITQSCWSRNPEGRPSCSDIIQILESYAETRVHYGDNTPAERLGTAWVGDSIRKFGTEENTASRNTIRIPKNDATVDRECLERSGLRAKAQTSVLYLRIHLRVLVSETLKKLNKDITRIFESLSREEAQDISDYLDKVLSEPDILSTDEGQHALTLLCKLGSSSRVYPQRYEISDPQFDEKDGPKTQGGFADVYKGSYMGRAVCVKVIKRPQSTHELGAYIKEIVMWGHLSHPNILPFFGVSVADVGGGPKIRIVSPWMDKGNLSDYAPKISQAFRMRLILDVINGLFYLHKLAIVHSDLKGNNVLISNEDRALITDFGISHIAAAASHGVTQGHTNSYIGYTLRWAAPEMFNSESEPTRPTKACDIWSFGCLCYEVLSLKLPFYEDRTDTKVLVNLVLGKLPTRPKPEGADCSNLIEDWVWDLFLMKCWCIRPEERPTCEGIRSVISQALDVPRNWMDAKPTNEDRTSYGREHTINYARVEQILLKVCDSIADLAKKAGPEKF